LNFVEKVKSELGLKASRREVIDEGGTYALREQSESYGLNFSRNNGMLSYEKNSIWSENSELTVSRLAIHERPSLKRVLAYDKEVNERLPKRLRQLKPSRFKT
jgi:hypothetical protein